MNRLVLVLAAVALVATGCRKTPVPREKTQQERADSYHRELTTPDLRLFGLRGAVMEAEWSAANEQWSTVVGGGVGLRAVFQPNGLLEAAILGSDSLLIVRNNAGEVMHLQAPDGQDYLPLIRGAFPQPTNVVYY